MWIYGEQDLGTWTLFTWEYSSQKILAIKMEISRDHSQRKLSCIILRSLTHLINNVLEEIGKSVLPSESCTEASPGYHAHPAGGPGEKFHYFKRCKVLENESRFQKYQYFFLPKKSIFSKKKFEKLNIFDRNLWIFSKNYLKIFKFYETYKVRENFGEFPYLVEKFSVEAKGIFRGNARATQRLSSAHRRGSGGRRPPPQDGSEVSFFKTIQSIWKWINFSKKSTFFFLKISIFLRKNFWKLNIFYKNFWIFSKNYFKFSRFMKSYKFREIFCEF